MYSTRASVPKSKKAPVRQHEGVHQRGPMRGKLKRGYKYSGSMDSKGLPQIVKVVSETKSKRKPYKRVPAYLAF